MSKEKTTGAFASVLEKATNDGSTITLYPGAPGNPWACAIASASLKPNTEYVVEFDYTVTGTNANLYFGIVPHHYLHWLHVSAPHYYAGTTPQHVRAVIYIGDDPDLGDVRLQFTSYGTDDVYITNVRFYEADDPNPFRFCGEYLDGETSTIYLRARFYIIPNLAGLRSRTLGTT